MKLTKELIKKRFKKLISDKYAHFVCFLSTTMIGGMCFVLTPYENHPFASLIGSFVGAFLIASAAMLKISVFIEESHYDGEIKNEEIKIKKQIEKIKKEEKEKSKKDIETLKEILNSLPTEHEDIKTKINQIYAYITTILENYPVDEKEKHYLGMTLQKDIQNSVQLFVKINQESQQEMKLMLNNMLDKKIKQLEVQFVQHYEQRLRHELKQQIILAETREM